MWEKYRKFNPGFPWGFQTVNQSTLPTLKKQLWALICPHRHSVTRPIQAQTLHPSALLSPPPYPPRNTYIPTARLAAAAFPQFHSPSSFFALCLFLPLSACWTPIPEPRDPYRRGGGNQTSVQSSVTTGSWKLQVWRRSRREFVLRLLSPSSPAGQSLYMKLIGLEGIMTPAYRSFLAVWGNSHIFTPQMSLAHRTSTSCTQQHAYTHSGSCAATCL